MHLMAWARRLFTSTPTKQNRWTCVNPLVVAPYHIRGSTHGFLSYTFYMGIYELLSIWGSIHTSTLPLPGSRGSVNGAKERQKG